MRNIIFVVILGLLAVVHTAPSDSVTQIPSKAENEVLREVLTDGFLLDSPPPAWLTTEPPRQNTTISASEQPSPDSGASDAMEGSAGDESDEESNPFETLHGDSTATPSVSETTPVLGESSDQTTVPQSTTSPIFDSKNMIEFGSEEGHLTTTSSTTTAAAAAPNTTDESSDQTTVPQSTTSPIFDSKNMIEFGSEEGHLTTTSSTTTAAAAAPNTTDDTTTTTSTTTTSSSTTSSSDSDNADTTTTSSIMMFNETEGSGSGMLGFDLVSVNRTSIVEVLQRHMDVENSTTIFSEMPEPNGESSNITEANLPGSNRSSRLFRGMNKPITSMQPPNASESSTKRSASGWMIIVGFVVGVAALVMLFVAIATRDRWNGPPKEKQEENNANSSHQKREVEMETFLNNDTPKQSSEYTVIPLDEQPENHS